MFLQTIAVRAPSHHNILGAVRGPELPLLGQVGMILILKLKLILKLMMLLTLMLILKLFLILILKLFLKLKTETDDVADANPYADAVDRDDADFFHLRRS